MTDTDDKMMAESEDGEDGPSPVSRTSPTQPQNTNPANTAPGWIDRLRALLGIHDPGRLRQDLEQALTDDPAVQSDFSPEEREMLRNILRLREMRIDDVMVPRADIDAVETDITLGAVLDIFKEAGHSRMPVYHESLDDPRGMVHIKDVMAHIIGKARPNGQSAHNLPQLDSEHIDLTKTLQECNLIREILFVPPSMPTTDLLAKMQTSRIQMALVIDEYGGTDGLISLEDVVETVVGDIEDEHDVDEIDMIVEAGADQWVADARVSLEDLTEVLGNDFHPGDHGEDVDTLGGLLFVLVGRIPVRGELITALPKFEFEVIDADQRRIKRLRIFKGQQSLALGRVWRNDRLDYKTDQKTASG